MFASGNYRFLTETTARYGTPGWLNMVLFLGVIAWEGTAAVLFWLACRTWRGKGQPGTPVRHAACSTAPVHSGHEKYVGVQSA